MRCKEIYDKLKTLGIPVAYHHFTKSPGVPFCVYFIDNRRRRGADNLNLLEQRTVRIELYTESKDEKLENKILKLFEDKELDVYEDYIDTEALYQVAIEFELIMKLTEE